MTGAYRPGPRPPGTSPPIPGHRGMVPTHTQTNRFPLRLRVCPSSSSFCALPRGPGRPSTSPTPLRRGVSTRSRTHDPHTLTVGGRAGRVGMGLVIQGFLIARVAVIGLFGCRCLGKRCLFLCCSEAGRGSPTQNSEGSPEFTSFTDLSLGPRKTPRRF